MWSRQLIHGDSRFSLTSCNLHSWVNCPAWTFKLTLPHTHSALSNTVIIPAICHVCLLHLPCPSISEHVLQNVIITTILEIRVEITDRLVWQDCLRAKPHSHSEETSLSSHSNYQCYKRVRNTICITAIYCRWESSVQ